MGGEPLFLVPHRADEGESPLRRALRRGEVGSGADRDATTLDGAGEDIGKGGREDEVDGDGDEGTG